MTSVGRGGGEAAPLRRRPESLGRSFPFRRTTPLQCGPESLECVFPATERELAKALADRKRSVRGPFVALGGCSNILMAASFASRGPFLSLRGLSSVETAPPLAMAQAGAPLARLVASTLPFSEALAPLSGIPGTVGGALAGNAGANGAAIGDYVESVRCFDASGGVATLTAKECRFSYRSSVFRQRRDLVIASAVFRFPSGGAGRARLAAARALELRRERGLGLEPSLGSFFKNPQGDSAGRLIDAAGLRGFALGGARVSPLHGNILTNPKGEAEPEEVFALAEHCRKTVARLYQINLEYEVVLYGFDIV